MNSKFENTLIYFGFRFGILVMVVAFLLLIAVALDTQELFLPLIFSLIGLVIGGAVSTFVSKRRWNRKYAEGLPVPCLICSREFTSEASHLSPAGSYRYAEVQCPHCNKMIGY